MGCCNTKTDREIPPPKVHSGESKVTRNDAIKKRDEEEKKEKDKKALTGTTRPKNPTSKLILDRDSKLKNQKADKVEMKGNDRQQQDIRPGQPPLNGKDKDSQRAKLDSQSHEGGQNLI